jgi:hypothetical protein
MGQNKGFLIYFLEILDKKGKKWRELLADEYLFCLYFKVVPYTSGKRYYDVAFFNRKWPKQKQFSPTFGNVAFCEAKAL